MRSTNQIDLVTIAEGSYYGLVEFVAHASIIICPTWHISKSAYSVRTALRLVRVGRVRPQQVTHQSKVGHIAWTLNTRVDVAQVFLGQVWAQSTMHAEYSLVDERGNRHVIKHSAEAAP